MMEELQEQLEEIKQICYSIGFDPEKVNEIKMEYQNILVEKGLQFMNSKISQKERLEIALQSQKQAFCDLHAELYESEIPELKGCGLLQQVEDCKIQMTALEKERKERMCVISEVTAIYDELRVPDEERITIGDIRPINMLQYRTVLCAKREELMEKRKCLQEWNNRCLSLLEELKLPQDKVELLEACDENIATLKVRVEALEKNKVKNMDIITDIQTQLTTIWHLVELPAIELENMFQQNMKYDVNTVQFYKDKLCEMIAYKNKKLKDMVIKARSTILELWNSMHYSQEARDKFDAFMVEDSQINDDLLRVHLEQVDYLVQCRDSIQPLVQYIEKREQIIYERTEYEASLQNANRLLNIGRDTGRLLREEKLQSRIKKDLPKITAYLHKKLPEWESIYHMSFLYGGKRYLDTMKDVDRAYLAAKQQEKENREQRKRIVTNDKPHSTKPIRTKPLQRKSQQPLSSRNPKNST